MQIGPLHFTGEVSLGSLLTICGIIYTCIKYLRHYVNTIQITNERTTMLWVKFNGKWPTDPDGWFNRLTEMESKVNQMWKRMDNNRVVIDEARGRKEDRAHRGELE